MNPRVSGVRWLVASVAAAVLASLTYAALFTLLNISAEAANGQVSGISIWLGLMALIVALPVHFLAIATLGPTVQRVLEKLRSTTWQFAALAGAGLAVLASAILFTTIIGDGGWGSLWLAAPAPLSGAVSGCVYRAIITMGR